MRYASAEPNKKAVFAGVFLASLLIVAILTFGINRYVVKENLVLKKPMVLLFIGTDQNVFHPLARDPTIAPGKDTILLSFIDPAAHKISLVSIPRDSLVAIPEHGLDRINNASSFGGYALTTEAVTELTGLSIDHYLVFNVEGFEKLVDLVGGIEIKVDQKVSGIDEYGKVIFSLNPGVHLLEGKTALQYARFGNDPFGDKGRINRQKALLEAFSEKAIQPQNIAKLPQFLELKKKYLQTDLTTKELIQLAGFAQQVDLEKGFFSIILPGRFYETYWQPDPGEVYTLMSKLKPAGLRK